MSGVETDFAKNIKALEWSKTELVHSLSGVFKAILKGDSEKIIDSLALLVINSFLLLKRLGLNYGQLEIRMYEKTAAMANSGHPLEEGYGDVSSLKGYLDLKR
ncbi:MAG: hypothetical protein CVU87_08335 [Firmicutes bacterium HGW-Firmicutes-12]|jgi:hypothetical protein|nr:MAG: hypothetical protein CVU87_08335 [Firmicutes bacterium HGW-Firmicutes-12]